MQTLTIEDVNNIIVLINKSPVLGSEATTVALLLQKLVNMRTEVSQSPKEAEKGIPFETPGEETPKEV